MSHWPMYSAKMCENAPSEDVLATSYPTVQDEMIAHTLHFNENGREGGLEAYMSDSVKVWEVFYVNMCDETCFVYTHHKMRAKHGRNAFFNLYGYYLGENNVNNIVASHAEGKIQSVVYTGETK